MTIDDLINGLRDHARLTNVTGGYPLDHPTMTGRAADALDAAAEMRETLAITASVLAGEKYRSGGAPFTGTWSIPMLGVRVTVGETLDKADAALAAFDKATGGGDD